MKLFLRNSSGFSMVQGLIVAGIVAASSLVTTRLMNNQKKTQKATEIKDKIEEFHKNLYSVLQHRQNCRETILRNDKSLEIITNNPVEIGSIYTYEKNICDPNDASSCLVAMAGEKYMNESFFLKNMELSAPSGGVRTLRIRYWKLDTTAKKAGKRAYGGHSIDKNILIRIQKQKTTTGNSFTSCYAFTAPGTAVNGWGSSEMGNDITKEMCNDMVSGSGQKIFTWDENRSICTPNAKCPFGQIYTGIDQDGTVKCRFIKDWMDFNEVIDPSAPPCPINARVGFEVIQATNKVRITCNVCSSSCDCPNMMDVCEAGICVDRTTGCIHGTYNRGDSICQGRCNGGYWTCPNPPVACPSLVIPTAPVLPTL